MNENRCFICGENNENVLEDHHIIPRRYDGGDDDENLVTLCSNCHQAIEKIYSDKIWRRINLCCKWDPDKSPVSRERIWKSRTLESQIKGWRESKRPYLQDRVDYDDPEIADPYEVESKEVAFQLGRFQAWGSLLRYLRSNRPDEVLEDGEFSHQNMARKSIGDRDD